jgi:Tol biopolymer transport system component
MFRHCPAPAAYLLLALVACGDSGTGPGERASAVAFVRRDSYTAPGRILVVDEQQRVTTVTLPSSRSVSAFSWGPRGQALAYVQGDSGIHLVNRDGTGARTIAKTATVGATFVEWSPDGRSIAFNGSGGTLFVATPDGTRLTRMAAATDESIWFPAWSSDSRRIAFNTYPSYRLGVVNADGSNLQLFDLPTAAAHPSWHPDGTELVYDDGRELWTVNADGTHPRKVATQCPQGSPCAGRWLEYPRWSPDGLKFLALVYAGPFAVLNADGTDVRVVTGLTGSGVVDAHPRWASDGRITFVSDRSGAPKIYIMNADTSGIRQLTIGTEYDDRPRWVP